VFLKWLIFLVNLTGFGGKEGRKGWGKIWQDGSFSYLLTYLLTSSSSLFMAALCNRAGHIYFHPVVCSSSSSSSLFPRLVSAVTDWMSVPYFHTWCGLSANLECRSETCCTRLAENTGRKKSPFWHHRTTLSGYIFATKECIDNRKKLLNSNTSSTCPDNTVNFGPPPTSGWDRFTSLGHPCKFQRVSLLGSVTARHSSSRRQPNFAALNRGRHLYAAGRPLRWAFAHILVSNRNNRLCHLAVVK